VAKAIDHLRGLLGASAAAVVSGEGSTLSLSFAPGSLED
jgi:hypothetical protein